MDGRSAQHKVSTDKGQHNTQKCRHISMSLAELELTIPEFEQSDTNTLDHMVNGTRNVVPFY